MLTSLIKKSFFNKPEKHEITAFNYYKNTDNLYFEVINNRKYLLIKVDVNGIEFSEFKDKDRLNVIRSLPPLVKEYNLELDSLNIFLFEFLSTIRIKHKISLTNQEQIVFRINSFLKQSILEIRNNVGYGLD